MLRVWLAEWPQCAHFSSTRASPSLVVVAERSVVVLDWSVRALQPGQRITVEGGRVVEGNFDDFPLLTIDQMPRIETHILANHQPPGGMGEVGLPPLAPAVANALFDLTGTRIRRLPIGRLG